MKLHLATLLCVGALACSHEKPAQSPHDSQAKESPSSLPYPTESVDEPPLTPASGVAVPRTSSVPPAAVEDSGIDQGDSDADLAITRQVRKNILADTALSFTAKNVTIITREGRVTLRGQVNTSQQRASIEKAARKVGAVKQVDNELNVLE